MKAPPQPPRWVTKLFIWWAKKAEIDDLLGDLEEGYYLNVERKGLFISRLKYLFQVFSLSFSYGLRKRKSAASYSNHYTQNSTAMIQNYFKIALRNFSKHKLFTSLNIIGLALGMSICLLALSITVAIYRSDEHNPLKNRIYQVNTFIESSDLTKTFGSTFHATGYHLQSQYPFIEDVIQVKSGFRPEIDHFGNNISFRGYYASDSFLETFDFKTLEGSAGTALSEPYSMVLTQSAAEKLFRDTDAIGKKLTTKDGEFTVTAVIADLKQTHLYFEVLSSFSTYEQLAHETPLASDWTTFRNNYVYVLLKDDADKAMFTEALAQTSTWANEFYENKKITLETVRLDQVVPRWNISNALGIGWDLPGIYFFMFIGLLVLLPAIFNYTNLSIARSLKRAKEIGIRKVVGAEKGQIKGQFIVETILITLLGFVGSLIIFIPVKHEFLKMVVAAEVLDTSMGLAQLTVFLLFTLLIGYATGILPARFFANINPVHTLKGEITKQKFNVSGVKKGLFVFQFFLSLVFIIGVGTIARQYGYVLNSNHGFDSDNILVVEFQGMDKQIVLNEFDQHPDVKSITATSALPGHSIPFAIEVTPNDADTIDVRSIFVGDEFLPSTGMKLKWGDADQMANSNQNEELVLVNQEYLEAISVFNLKKDTLTFTLADGTNCRIVGILDDVKYEPLTKDIDPIIIRYSIDQSQYAMLTINSNDVKKTIDELDAIWSGIDQTIHFESSFLDAEIERSYSFIKIQIKIFTFLSILAVAISCLGLLGMVSYTTENRTKEIAIRKIMGASNNSLYYLLTQDFIKLIAISAAFAIPFSYFFYDKLFLYFLIKLGLGLGALEVIGSILFLFFFGFLTIYWQTSRVARSNPATNLRYE